jgi:hypothetical protein
MSEPEGPISPKELARRRALMDFEVEQMVASLRSMDPVLLIALRTKFAKTLKESPDLSGEEKNVAEHMLMLGLHSVVASQWNLYLEEKGDGERGKGEGEAKKGPPPDQ